MYDLPWLRVADAPVRFGLLANAGQVCVAVVLMLLVGGSLQLSKLSVLDSGGRQFNQTSYASKVPLFAPRSPVRLCRPAPLLHGPGVALLAVCTSRVPLLTGAPPRSPLRRPAKVSFLVPFAIAKSVANLAVGFLADRLGRKWMEVRPHTLPSTQRSLRAKPRA